MKVTETCPCGAKFEVTSWVNVEGLGGAIVDFRRRHELCRVPPFKSGGIVRPPARPSAGKAS